MAKFFGSDATPGSLRIAVIRHVNPHVKLAKDHANSGGDCKDLYIAGDLQTEAGKSGKGQTSALHIKHFHNFLMFLHLRSIVDKSRHCQAL